MKDLENRNAIITGASRGLGVHIARELAREGVNLVLVARSADALEHVRKEMESYKVSATAIPMDLTDTAKTEALINEAEQKTGPVDILINNAGVEYVAPFDEFPPEQIHQSVYLNLLAPMLLTRAVLPKMLKRGSGHIVNISSLAGKTGFPFQSPYAAAKAGLNEFTHSLRSELSGKPVGISAICPGFVAEDGMFARRNSDGNPVPKLLKPTTPEKVTIAVMKAIKQDKAEVVVNKIPTRPVTIFREMFSESSPFLHKVIGLTGFVKKITGNERE